MGEAIGQVLPLGIAATLSPLPIIAVVLMLGGRRGQAKGLAFLLGWLLGLATIGTVALLIAAAVDPSDGGEPATWVSLVTLALGLLVLLLAMQTWRKRPAHQDEAKLPAWTTALGTWRVGRAFGAGVALSAINPKNLMLTFAAGGAIAQTGIAASEQAVALAVFVVIGTLGPGVPVIGTLLLGDRATRRLSDLEAWLARHSAAVVTVVMLLIGSNLIGDAVAGLSG